MAADRFSLDGQSAIVTGSSSGIGEAIARGFGAAGADVLVCAPEGELDALERVAADIAADGPGDATVATCDVTDRASLPPVADAAVDAFGGLDVLVNNAGGGHPRSPLVDMDPATWYDTVELNLHGTYNATTTIGPRLFDGGGAIVNIASLAGFRGKAGMGPYAAAKAAIINLTRTAAFEFAHHDVRVNAIAPGLVSSARVREAQYGGRIPAPEDIDRGHVARRVGRPAEIADVARFLASPAASYITGSTVRAEGVPRLETSLEVARTEHPEDA